MPSSSPIQSQFPDPNHPISVTMARLAVTFAVIFSLFVLTRARVQFNQPENLFAEWNPSNDLPDSDSKTTILLPTEKIESEAVVPVKELPESDLNSFQELPESDPIAAIGITRPLTMTYDISFRPINRHFHHMQMKHPFHSRFPHRCRHHGKHFGPRFAGGEIPYGNDMLMSEEANFDPMSRGDVRQIPARSMERLGGKRFPYRPREEERMPRHVEDEEEREERQEEGGFVERFRKFLNHF